MRFNVQIDFGIVNPSIWYYHAGVKTVTYKVDPGLYAWLDQESRRLGRSKSAITRDALEKARSEKKAPSCHDLMSDICGSMRSGVRDLATNKKYMKGFGEWKR